VDTLAEAPHSALSGVARVLVHAGKLTNKAAEDLVKSSREKRTSFVASVIGAGAVSPGDLAHTLSSALALPLLDLAAVDLQRLPRNVIDGKLAAQYQVVVLGKRANRIFIAGADPTDQEAVERIKFATQLSPEWVIVEHDKLAKALEGSGASANETMEALSSGDFEFDVTDDVGTTQDANEVTAEVEDAPVVRFMQ
jgi:type IV pilus assembly protein PilB